ncbi:DNA internalization-related competence protein ComEC/Rec2 [Pontibacillus salipaludis]|uniref:DNA internalization-related competence protein ComEC/Rec2 n=1 Tax=Pontibacillus salipaludis TaxID=1697394 RepID=UPI0031EF90F8
MKGNGYWLAIASALGVYLAPISYSWLGGFLVLGGVIIFRPAKRSLLLASGVLFIVCSTTDSFKPLSSPTFSTSVVQINGVVKEDPTFTSDYTSFIFEHDQTKQKWNTFLFASLDHRSVQIGSKCSLSGEVERHPFARNPGEFDYEAFMLHKGVRGTIIVDPSQLHCQGGSWYKELFSKRKEALDNLDQNLSPFTSSWVKALVFGEDRDLSEETIDLFQRWGLSHLLAISGLHVGLCIALFSYLTLRFSLLTKRKLIICLLFLLPIYILFAGGAPSVIRAVCMAEAAMLLSLMKKRWPMTDIISYLFCSILIFKPSLIHQLGFQFSFIVTFGILVSKKWISLSVHPIDSLLRISLLCQLIVLPLQLQSFYFFNPLSLLANLLFVPLMSIFVLPVCFIILAGVNILPPSLLQPLDAVFQKSLEICFLTLRGMDEFDVEWVTGQMSIVSILLFVIAFVWMMKRWEGGKQRQSFLWGVGLSFILIAEASVPFLFSPGRVTMLDIGQGDCFIIEWPNQQHVMMIDAAGVLEEGEDDTFTRIIEPYLHQRGIKKVDTLLLTHADQDHIGAAEEVLTSFSVDTLITSPFFKGDLPIKEEKWKKVSNGDRFVIEETVFDILYPIQESEDKNDNSLVMSFTLGGMAWMFTGDVGKEGEEDISSLADELDVDVLKVAHHGSDTSTGAQWLDTVTPKVALISAGLNNRYGHPHEQVIERLNKEGVKIIRTDQKGAVIYQFSGGTGTFYSHLP